MKNILFALLIFGCFTAKADLFGDRCALKTHGNFDAVLELSRKTLTRKNCSVRFIEHFNTLLRLAEGYPSPENKRKFSDYLIWASDRGVTTRQHAEELYNRYFATKFLLMMDSYNLCSSICRNEATFITNMEQELADKERGLIRISRDTETFAKASQLYSDSVVVVSATCRACSRGQ